MIDTLALARRRHPGRQAFARRAVHPLRRSTAATACCTARCSTPSCSRKSMSSSPAGGRSASSWPRTAARSRGRDRRVRPRRPRFRPPRPHGRQAPRNWRGTKPLSKRWNLRSGRSEHGPLRQRGLDQEGEPRSWKFACPAIRLDTGSALQEHAADRLNAISDKYFNRAMSSQVTFGKAPNGAFACDIVTARQPGPGAQERTARRRTRNQALDTGGRQDRKQLRRYKRRLKDRHEQTDLRGRSRRKPPTRCSTPAEPEAEEAPEAPAGDRRDPHRYSRSQRGRRGDDARLAPHQRAVLQKRWHRAA